MSLNSFECTAKKWRRILQKYADKPLVKLREGLYVKRGIAVTIMAKEVLTPHRTAFQEVALYWNDTFGHILVLDGNIQWFEKGHEYYTYPTTLFPILARYGKVKNVLIIGGGDLLNAALLSRIPFIERIDVVDIDKRVRELTMEYVPGLIGESINDPRLTTYDMDAAEFVRTLAGRFELYDAIIIDSTDETDAARPIFTRSFLGQVASIMRPAAHLVHVAGSAVLQKKEVAGTLDNLKEVFGEESTGALLLSVPMYLASPFVIGVGCKGCPFSSNPARTLRSIGITPSHYFNDKTYSGIAHSYVDIRSVFD